MVDQQQELPMRERISTLVKQRDYANDEETGDAWSFSIGWNRNLDPSTGIPKDEPRDARFLTNEI